VGIDQRFLELRKVTDFENKCLVDLGKHNLFCAVARNRQSAHLIIDAVSSLIIHMLALLKFQSEHQALSK